jgi:hypothetical protein
MADAPPADEKPSFPLLPVMIAAVTSGIIVSLLELACTGQVYLPAIRMMLFDASGRRLRAAGYLVTYNVCFIVPLVGVFLLAYAGVTSEQLRAWLNRRLGLTKLAMGAFFLLLAGAIVAIEML